MQNVYHPGGDCMTLGGGAIGEGERPSGVFDSRRHRLLDVLPIFEERPVVTVPRRRGVHSRPDHLDCCILEVARMAGVRHAGSVPFGYRVRPALQFAPQKCHLRPISVRDIHGHIGGRIARYLVATIVTDHPSIVRLLNDERRNRLGKFERVVAVSFHPLVLDEAGCTGQDHEEDYRNNSGAIHDQTVIKFGIKGFGGFSD